MSPALLWAERSAPGGLTLHPPLHLQGHFKGIHSPGLPAAVPWQARCCRQQVLRSRCVRQQQQAAQQHSALPALRAWQQEHLPQQPQQPQQHVCSVGRHLQRRQAVLACRPGCSPAGGRNPAGVLCRAAASSPAFNDNDGDSGSNRSSSASSGGGGILAAAGSLTAGLADTAADLRDLVNRFLSLWRQFLPMLSLFFCLSFINTILDSLKDTLVITARGGGAFVIPYLTVYAVLPMSMVFLVAFSAASRRVSRSALFNTIVGVFVAFFGVFALFLYPNADVLHPHALADQLQQVLPQGLAGFVGMLRNWTFTLFFCMSELWGDVCMGLLFWGLANEITNLSDAATLYPLFGLGANLAQALAGMVLKATTRGGATEFGTALQASMAAVVGIACVAIMLQQHITNKAEAAAAAQRHRHLHRHNSANSRTGSPDAGAAEPAAAAAASQEQPQQNQQQQEQEEASKPKKQKEQVSLAASFKVLAASVEIRCLAVMSLAQGLCNSLMEFAWKCHMRLLYPSPADFTAFLGDVATWSGVVTGGLMLLSPLLFERLGWRGVANATPTILLYGGSAFFLACIVYQHMFGHAVAAAGAGAAGAAGVALLQGLVLFGALLYVFGKGAKFSLFKPAEEMVYITLDEDGRTRGKAAIDVVGAQTGKSGGSLLQQALLITSAGSIVGIMPVLFAVFFAMLRGWSSAVHTLSNVRHYSYDSPISSMDEEDGQEQDPQRQGGSAGAGAAVVGTGGHSSSSSSSSSDSLPAEQQQQQLDLLEKLQGVAGGEGGVGASKGSKAFQAAVARSSSGGGPGSTIDSSHNGLNTTSSSGAGAAESQPGSSSSSGGSSGGHDATASGSSSSPKNGTASTASSSNGRAGVQQQQQQQHASGHTLESVTLSHDAAHAFRQSRRAAPSTPAVHSSNTTSSNSSRDSGSNSSDSRTDSSSTSAGGGVDSGDGSSGGGTDTPGSSSSSSRVVQGGDIGTA